MYIALVLALAVVFAACGGDDDDSAGGGGGGGGGGETKLVVGTDAEPTTLDIQVTDDNGLQLATWSINESLVDFDAEGNLEPVLAAELPVMNPDDPTHWTVKLREGVTFTDGEPLTCEAVRLNLERMIDPDFGSTIAEELGSLNDVKAIDDTTCELITKEPDSLVPRRLRKLRLISPKAFAQADETPVGTGSYVFDSWQKGVSLTVKANPDYWGDPKPEIDVVEIRFIPDVNTRLSALQANEIDIAINIPESQLGEVPQVIEALGGESGGTRFNTSIPPYDDVNFRQALNYAINKQEMIDKLFNGLFEVEMCQMWPPTAQGFNTDLQPYPYDPEKAKELLAKVDLPPGFKVDFNATSAVYGTDREIGETIASYWRDIGLEVDVTFDEIDAYLEKIYDPQIPLVYDETDDAMNSAARQIATFLTEGGPVTALGPEDQAALNPLVETATNSVNEADAEKAMKEIAKIACDEAYFVFTFERKDLTAASDKVEYTPDLGNFEKADWNRVHLSS